MKNFLACARTFFAIRKQPLSIDLAILLLRVVVGLAFVLHGWGKIQHPLAWMGPDSPVPAFFQFLAAFSEFFGGLALISGLLVRLAGMGILCTMAVAVSLHAFAMHAPFVAAGPGPSFELPAAYFLIALLFITTGPGRVSLDRLCFGKK